MSYGWSFENVWGHHCEQQLSLYYRFGRQTDKRLCRWHTGKCFLADITTVTKINKIWAWDPHPWRVSTSWAQRPKCKRCSCPGLSIFVTDCDTTPSNFQDIESSRFWFGSEKTWYFIGQPDFSLYLHSSPQPPSVSVFTPWCEIHFFSELSLFLLSSLGTPTRVGTDTPCTSYCMRGYTPVSQLPWQPAILVSRKHKLAKDKHLWIPLYL